MRDKIACHHLLRTRVYKEDKITNDQKGERGQLTKGATSGATGKVNTNHRRTYAELESVVPMTEKTSHVIHFGHATG